MGQRRLTWSDVDDDDQAESTFADTDVRIGVDCDDVCSGRCNPQRQCLAERRGNAEVIMSCQQYLSMDHFDVGAERG